jgi:hypothetical protein
MKRVIALLGIVSALALSAHANIVDFDNDPGSGYQFYFDGGANRIVLDDVGRVTPGGALIKQINIGFANLNQFAVNATLYVYDATGAGGGVGNLLYTATIQNIPNGLFQLQFGTPNIGGGQQNLWIGLAASAASAGMLLSPAPNPTVGTSQDVFAFDQNGNGVIDTNEYFFFGGNPGCELRDSGAGGSRACEHAGAGRGSGGSGRAAPPQEVSNTNCTARVHDYPPP